MAQKQFKIGLSNTDKQNMAQDVYERVLALTFNEYDTTTEYDVGDFVVYNDQLYKCIGATSGAWDSSKWQLATLNDLVDDIENAVAFVNDKANVDGNYPTMTVGAADNLTPYDEESGVDQEQPFLLQGTGCGNGEQQVDTGALGLLKEKQGHTVVVNQKSKFKQNGTCYGVTLTNNADGSCSLVGTAEPDAYGQVIIGEDVEFKRDGTKKYLVACFGNGNFTYGINGYGAEHNEPYIFFKTGQATSWVGGIALKMEQGDTVNLSHLVAYVIDLTQWFGSNDNIPAHLLAHPEDFFRYYQGSLAYNEGTLVNADGRYLKAIGRNQWDEEWEGGSIDTQTGQNVVNGATIRTKNYIKVIPNATYNFHVPWFWVFLYDVNKNFIEAKQSNGVSGQLPVIYDDGNCHNAQFTIPSNCCYIRARFSTEYGTTYNHDITISIYYEDESGYDQYYPYEVLTNNDTGTEVLRSAGSVKDSKAPDGTITRRIGSVDLGTLSWTYTSDGIFVSYGLAGLSKQVEDPNTVMNATCDKYVAQSYSGHTDKGVYTTWKGTFEAIYIVDTSLSGDTTAISGTLNYELATPTTEQGTPYSENIAIDDFGSMDFGGTNGVPQGASIFYAVDYKAFIDSLYNTLDGDATDIVKESELDSKLATLGYVKLTSVSGYDATKTQVLKNVEGTLTWVTEE